MKITKKDINYYQLGNVIKTKDSQYFLIIQSLDHQYSLLNLKTNTTVSIWAPTLERVAEIYKNKDDLLVNAKLVVDR